MIDFDTMVKKAKASWNSLHDQKKPVIFAGAGLKPQRVYREIATVDIASTLSEFTGTNRPSGARGQVLPEVMH